jgi:hypothetical protein
MPAIAKAITERAWHASKATSHTQQQLQLPLKGMRGKINAHRYMYMGGKGDKPQGLAGQRGSLVPGIWGGGGGTLHRPCSQPHLMPWA